jgi:hypothetical protein
MSHSTVLTPAARHRRRTNWAATGLETGAVLFAVGLTLLYLNPFWHFDESGFLDWRVYWWNGVCQVLTGGGLLIEAIALVGAVAVIVSRLARGRLWPYAAAVFLALGVLIWVSPAGLLRNLNAHFEWNAADGFEVFRLQSWDDSTQTWRDAGSSKALRAIVEIQLQPLLRGYFKLNDWQKMNGDINVKVAQIVPVAWPVALGSGGETLEDPDETALMRAAVQGDLKAVQELLSVGVSANVNALDQGGQSALILACETQKTNPSVVKALIAAGANVNLRARNGYTALTWALARNHPEIVRALRRAGGRP